jgi:hypothetical protein
MRYAQVPHRPKWQAPHSPSHRLPYAGGCGRNGRFVRLKRYAFVRAAIARKPHRKQLFFRLNRALICIGQQFGLARYVDGSEHSQHATCRHHTA